MELNCQLAVKEEQRLSADQSVKAGAVEGETLQSLPLMNWRKVVDSFQGEA